MLKRVRLLKRVVSRFSNQPDWLHQQDYLLKNVSHSGSRRARAISNTTHAFVPACDGARFSAGARMRTDASAPSSRARTPSCTKECAYSASARERKPTCCAYMAQALYMQRKSTPWEVRAVEAEAGRDQVALDWTSSSRNLAATMTAVTSSRCRVMSKISALWQHRIRTASLLFRNSAIMIHHHLNGSCFCCILSAKSFAVFFPWISASAP